MIKKGRGRPKLTDEEKLERQKAKIADLAVKKKKKFIDSSSDKKDSSKFTTKKVLKGANPLQQKVEVNVTTKVLLTPAGKCPVDLLGFDEESVRDWLTLLKDTKVCGCIHSIQSLSYWVRDFYDVFSSEYKIVREIIKDMSKDLEIMDYEPILKQQQKAADERIASNFIEKLEDIIEIPYLDD